MIQNDLSLCLVTWIESFSFLPSTDPAPVVSVLVIFVMTGSTEMPGCFTVNSCFLLIHCLYFSIS